MDYRETVQQKRANSAQSTKEQNELASMVREMRQITAAALAGSAGKSTVILTDQTDLGDKISELATKFENALQGIDGTELSKHQILEIKKVGEAIKGLSGSVFQSTQSSEKQTKEIISAIRGLDMSPNITVPTPKVTVESNKIDFTALENAISNLKTEVVFPEPIIDRFDLSRYRAQDIKETEDKQYVGFVNPEGCWYIIENDLRANRMRYVFGESGYSKHFAQASTWKYQILDKAINAF